MNCSRRTFVYIILILLGATLLGLGWAGSVDEFWSGMGWALVAVSVLRLIQLYRFHKDEAYRENFEIELKDERSRFIRSKAWAWSGYLFILITACSVIVLRVMDQELLSMAASYGICLMLILYWGAYMVLRKKY